MTEEEKKIFNELQQIARLHKIHCRAMLNISGGAGWINYKKIEENDYKIQLSIPGNFDEYKQIRDSISNVFNAVNAVLISEETYGNRTFGFQKELIYMDSLKNQKNCDSKKITIPQNVTIQTQINGDISTGGNLNTGNAQSIDNSYTSAESDEKWFQKEIVKMILSFIVGVASTLVTQWIIKIIG